MGILSRIFGGAKQDNAHRQAANEISVVLLTALKPVEVLTKKRPADLCGDPYIVGFVGGMAVEMLKSSGQPVEAVADISELVMKFVFGPAVDFDRLSESPQLQEGGRNGAKTARCMSVKHMTAEDYVDIDYLRARVENQTDPTEDIGTTMLGCLLYVYAAENHGTPKYRASVAG